MINEGLVASFVMLIIVVAEGLIALFLTRAGKASPKIRNIPGLEAIEEAVGRATEMGRPIAFTTGLGGIRDQYYYQTIAGLNILGYTSELAAKYGAKLIYYPYDPTIMPMAVDVMEQSYIRAGKSDEFNPENIEYLGGDQFPWAFGVLGRTYREKIAASIHMGPFWAESLILAESGFYSGAIQIAGTANYHQIHFFVVAADYALIGEELMAAGAYLSKDPTQIGSLWGADFSKITTVALILIGVILTAAGVTALNDFFAL
ncbi:MAG: hypothetical protein JSV05_00325 [Candidatus Bathyarchaeota archaeon]|nr:MAG: hypothetical protein JSV05_00325 [Candidatus Bathyarchaeota archaeon]